MPAKNLFRDRFQIANYDTKEFCLGEIRLTSKPHALDATSSYRSDLDYLLDKILRERPAVICLMVVYLSSNLFPCYANHQSVL
jgi:hypothetical protein